MEVELGSSPSTQPVFSVIAPYCLEGGREGGEMLDTPKPSAELDDVGSECCVPEKGGSDQRY